VVGRANGVDHTRSFHDIATAISKSSARTLVLDGGWCASRVARGLCGRLCRRSAAGRIAVVAHCTLGALVVNSAPGLPFTRECNELVRKTSS
jgi:hypothetical protein